MLLNIFIALIISIPLNVVFFIIAFLVKKDIFTDITYTSTFIITTIIIMIINSSYELNQYLVLTLIAIWSIRLGTFLFIRIYKTKADHRFDNIHNSFLKFELLICHHT